MTNLRSGIVAASHEAGWCRGAGFEGNWVLLELDMAMLSVSVQLMEISPKLLGLQLGPQLDEVQPHASTCLSCAHCPTPSFLIILPPLVPVSPLLATVDQARRCQCVTPDRCAAVAGLHDGRLSAECQGGQLTPGLPGRHVASPPLGIHTWALDVSGGSGGRASKVSVCDRFGGCSWCYDSSQGPRDA